MSIMHSFYCWGVVFTVAASTLFFTFAGIENWKVLALIWALIPMSNAVLMLFVPMDTMESAEMKEHSASGLFKIPLFWLMLVLMLCAGAAELSVAQWASAFTESALGVDKTLGDMLGACGFAFMMALSRTIYGKFSEKLPLRPALIASAVLCVVGYLMIGLAPTSMLGLVGCMVCGFAVGIFWPGTLSLSASKMPHATTAMFALLAVAGDIGCALGPTAVGAVSSLLGGDLKLGILSAVVFPIILLISLSFLKIDRKNGLL